MGFNVGHLTDVLRYFVRFRRVRIVAVVYKISNMLVFF